MNIFKKTGFTLIELLVVIGIISILSSIVLVSVNKARNRAVEVAVREDFTQARGLAEVYFSENAKYDGICTEIDKVILAVAKATHQAKTAILCGGTSQLYNGWYIAIKLSTGGDYLCMDEAGELKITDGGNGFGAPAQYYCPIHKRVGSPLPHLY